MGEIAFDLSRAPVSATTVLELLEQWQVAEPFLDRLAKQAGMGALEVASIGNLSELALRAPILYPGALLCAGANYRKHVKEMTGAEFDKTDKRPYLSAHFRLRPGDVISTGTPPALDARSGYS